MHVLSAGGYLWVVRINHARGTTVWDPSTTLDAAIPLIPWSVVAYASFYVYGPLTALATPRSDPGRHQLLLLYQALLVVNVLCYAVFLLVPCEIHLVQQVPQSLVQSESVLGAIFRRMHEVDRPYNAWPSLHACMSLLMVLYLVRLCPKVWLQALLWTAWSLMAASILTTKQHFLFDLVTGVILALLTWRWVLRPALARAADRPRS